MNTIRTQILPPPRNPNFIDMAGDVCNMLTIIGYVGAYPQGKSSLWLCQCECGRLVNRTAHPLRHKLSYSCGCRKGTSHRTLHPLYNIWNKMIRRCEQPHSSGYEKYGQRGIRVCKGWHVFDVFTTDMGIRPAGRYSIDRINNNGNYSCGHCEECLENEWPMNCKWSDDFEQASNRRSSKYITIDGVTRTAKQWADFLGRRNADYIYKRLRMEWEPQDAVLLPVDITHKYKKGENGERSAPPAKSNNANSSASISR